MIAGLPRELGDLFEATSFAVLVTVDGRGHPVAAGVPARHDAENMCFELTSNAGLADAHVAMALVAPPAQICVRPERVLHWPDGDLDGEPVLYDARLEEVRSHHNQEPERPHETPADGTQTRWDDRLDALAALDGAQGTLAVIAPDGFPFAVRVPVTPDRDGGTVRIGADPVGAPFEPGPAALLLADDEGELLLRGDLLEDAGTWVLRPHDGARA
jgi:hypothetical protein